jgi:uncharacterized membrane protein YbaN (DUF454 family)
MIKLLLIVLDSIFLGLGFLGIFTPGLPTTPFYYWQQVVMSEAQIVYTLGS